MPAPTYAQVAAPPEQTAEPPRSRTDSVQDETDDEKTARALIGTALDAHPSHKPYSVAIPQAPWTYERQPYVPDDDTPLMDAGTARATIAASREQPHGSSADGWTRTHQHQLVLQQHVAYFDRDGDGVIWPGDTYRGCRRYGWGRFLSALAATLIHLNLSYPSCPSLLPDPALRIWVKGVHRNKHGSDSMTYDTEGRFRPQNFEDLFAKYDRGRKGGLDAADLWRMWNGQRLVFDFFGWSATFLEWLAVYLLLWPEDGVLKKEDVRRVFDGSIFEYKARENEEKKKKKKKKKKQQQQAMRKKEGQGGLLGSVLGLVPNARTKLF